MAKEPKKNVRAAVAASVNVRTQTMAATKLALATTFLGASFLAAAATASLPANPVLRSAVVSTPIGVTMSNVDVPNPVQFIPATIFNTNGQSMMAFSLSAPRGLVATLKAVDFKFIRATDAGWVNDPAGCGFAEYSLTGPDGALLGLTARSLHNTSSVRFVLKSPLVISDTVTLQLRPTAFFSQISQPAVAQALHGCRLMPVLAPVGVDLVGANNQPLPVLSGPVYGAITQVLLAKPELGWAQAAPPTVIAESAKTADLASVYIKNVTRNSQQIFMRSLSLNIRTNARALESVVVTLTPSAASQDVYTQTILPEEWGTQFEIASYSPRVMAWPIAPNEATGFVLSVDPRALQGQPDWYICVSVSPESQLTWSFATGTPQTSVVELPEFCVTKP